MKSDRILEDIKSRLDIVEVVGEYVALKRAGQNYKAACPFHPEKTPSFIVSPQKQLFHCFGCGAGGDIFGFVMKHENLPFEEALQLLAKKAGIEYEPRQGEGKKGKDDKEALKSILKESLSFFRDNLKKSQKALSYLKERGIKETSVADFSLGYTPRGWHSLFDFLKAKGFSEALIIQSGVVSKGDKGPHDFMRDRIILPIFNIREDVIAFGGRVMDDSIPKYLNSPDTPLFKKSETLYGLSKARKGIKEKGYAAVVEGYLDVIMCHQHGLTNAVAPLGTALTQEQMKILRRFTDKVVLTFDGDEAGISAARRSLPIALEHDFKVKILLLPEGEDPDSILRKHGVEEMKKLLGRAVPTLHFLLKSLKGERADLINEAIAVISRAKNPIVRDEFIMELSDRTKVRESVIRDEIKKLSKSERPPQREIVKPTPYNEEVLLLSAVIAFPEKIGNIIKFIDIEDLSDSAVRGVFRKILSLGGDAETGSLLRDASAGEQAIVSRLVLNRGFDADDVENTVYDCIKKIMKRKMDEKIRAAEIAGDLKLLTSLLSERQRLLKERLYERQL